MFSRERASGLQPVSANDLSTWTDVSLFTRRFLARPVSVGWHLREELPQVVAGPGLSSKVRDAAGVQFQSDGGITQSRRAQPVGFGLAGDGTGRLSLCPCLLPLAPFLEVAMGVKGLAVDEDGIGVNRPDLDPRLA